MRVPVKRKLDAGAALRDRLKAAGDGLGSQVVADLVGSLRASHQNSSALFAELKEARGLMKPFAAAAEKLDGLWNENDWRWNDSVRSNVTVRDIRAVSAFLARNGKGEG